MKAIKVQLLSQREVGVWCWYVCDYCYRMQFGVRKERRGVCTGLSEATIRWNETSQNQKPYILCSLPPEGMWRNEVICHRKFSQWALSQEWLSGENPNSVSEMSNPRYCSNCFLQCLICIIELWIPLSSESIPNPQSSHILFLISKYLLFRCTYLGSDASPFGFHSWAVQVISLYFPHCAVGYSPCFLFWFFGFPHAWYCQAFKHQS